MKRVDTLSEKLRKVRFPITGPARKSEKGGKLSEIGALGRGKVGRSVHPRKKRSWGYRECLGGATSGGLGREKDLVHH